MYIENKSKILISVVLLMVAYIIFNNDGSNYNIYVLSINFLIAAFSVFNLLTLKSRPFSLNNIAHLFFLFFLGISPALQFKNNVYFLGELGKLNDSSFLKGNLIFFSIVILYTVLYQLMYNKINKSKGEYNRKGLKNDNLNINNKYLILLSLVFSFSFFIFLNFNLEAIFLRSYLWKNKLNYNTSTLAIFNVVRGAPLLLFLYYKLGAKKDMFTEILLLGLILICNFPIAIPRYKFAIIYLPIIIIYVKPLFKKYYFSLAFVLSFLTIFPYLSHFRYTSELIPKKIFDFKMFTSAHFDTYQNSINVIVNDLITNGEQLLSVLLFFVPRSIWETKSKSSGYLLAEKLNYDGFSNVAVSYFAEGYINFGFFGILLFIILIAFLNAQFDFAFWKKQNLKISSTIIYLILIPFEFFILRGSLLASFANLFGYVFMTLLLYALLVKRPKFLTTIK